MKKYAIVSYNKYCNFTNYGSALQTYALQRFLNYLSPNRLEVVVLDYCPDVLKKMNILAPTNNMLDIDEASKRMVELSMSAIQINYKKFNDFYSQHVKWSNGKYTSENFEESLKAENLDGYICGSDTIWCIREFEGFDDGYYGNFSVMKQSQTISYAASFGDVDFQFDELELLKERLQNYKAISVRESTKLDFIKENTSPKISVERVIDPTLLLKGTDYSDIIAEKQIKEPYVLLYARRYNKTMEEYTDRLADSLNCKVVEISLRAINSDRHIMRYDAGVEEFLSLIKNAEYVVTNSFHGVIFAIQMHTPFKVFSRERADAKIDELLSLLCLKNEKLITGRENDNYKIDFNAVEERLNGLRAKSKEYLIKALNVYE